MNEVWRSIPSYPAYEVSDCGRVRRVSPYNSTRSGRLIRLRHVKSGHVHARLSQNGKVTDTGVHRLICEAFHGAPPTPKHMAAHWNGIPSENRPDNIRWATRQENSDDRYDHDDVAFGERNGWAKLMEEDVNLIRSHLMYGERVKIVAWLFSICENHVRSIRAGKSWPHLEFQL